MYAGDKVTADIDGTLYTGTIIAFNASGHSALIWLSAAADGHPAGARVPVPVRMLKVAA